MRSPSVAIIGAGPAGLFCADTLADRGIPCEIYDAGHLMTRRWCPETRICDCKSCYVLEGEGGAGGFSDGKLPFSLTRGTQLEIIFPWRAESLLQQINQTVVDLAGPGVWYDPKPSANLPWKFPKNFSFSTYPLRHVGSDGVRRWSTGMTERVRARGVKIHYRSEVTSLRPNYVEMADGSTIEPDLIVLASGIQGIPWSERILTEMGVELEHGPAGIGLRVETPAEDMASLFSRFYDWKIVYEPEDSPVVMRSFCCNQNGAIVNQYHRQMGIRGVNGHASLDPDERTQSSNFAVIAKIPTGYVADPQDYVKSIARSINALTGGHTAVQWLTEFLDKVRYAPMPCDVEWRTNAIMAREGADIARAIPSDLMDLFGEFIRGIFNSVSTLDVHRALVYAPELKYPAMRVPVDLDSWRLKGHPEIYVVGDATGYLDSFVAAALSGIMAAQHIAGGNQAKSNGNRTTKEIQGVNTGAY